MSDPENDDVRAIVNPERTDAADDLAANTAADLVEPGTPDEIATAAEEAVDDGADVVAAVGGDGTQRTVAEAVAGTDADLAVVPGGTVNLLARVLGVETVTDATAAIEHGDTRNLDLGRCGDRSFILNSSSGYDAAVIAHTDDRAKRFGRLGYTMVGLSRLLAADSASCRVTVDGRPFHDGPALTVLVLNVGQRGSSSFKIAPDAEPDDGKLDIVVIAGRRRSLVRALYARLRHRLPSTYDATFTQGTAATVHWSEPVSVQCDGDEIGTMTDIDYGIEPGAVRVRSLDR